MRYLSLIYFVYLRYGNVEKQQEIKREKREQDKIRKESLGKFFYDPQN